MSDNPNVYQGQLGAARPNDVQLSADGSKIYATGADGVLRVYSPVDGSLLNSWQIGSELGAIDVSPDGTFAMVVEKVPVGSGTTDWGGTYYDIAVYRVDLSTGAKTSIERDTLNYTFSDVAVLADGSVLLSQNSSATYFGSLPLQRLDLVSGQFSYVESVSGASLSAAADGSYVVVSARNSSSTHLYFAEGGLDPNQVGGPISAYDPNNDVITWFDYGYGLMVRDRATDDTINLRDTYLWLWNNVVAGLAFDSTGQHLCILRADTNTIVRLSTSDWTIIDEIAVGAEITQSGNVINNLYGNMLLPSPDGSFFTVFADNALILVDPATPVMPTEGPDALFGTTENDTINALGGDDYVLAHGGDDTIYGGLGRDEIHGGEGDDYLDGGAGQNKLFGDAGDDHLLAVGGANILVGGSGADVIEGGGTLFSDQEDLGGSFFIDSGAIEADTLIGKNSDDFFYAGVSDTVNGAEGVDTLFISFDGATSGISFDFALPSQTIAGGTISAIEDIGWIKGSSFDDYIDLSAIPPSSFYFHSSPSIFGEAGNDILIGSASTANISGGEGHDILDGRASGSHIGFYGGDGNDVIYSATIQASVAFGDAGDDLIYAFGNADGGDGDDTIIVQGGDPRFASSISFVGNAGDDTMTGSNGIDCISGGDGADSISGGEGDDILVSSNASMGVGWGGEKLLDKSAEHDVLVAGGGDDRVSGGSGDDLDGGTGQDILRLDLTAAMSALTLNTSSLTNGGEFSFGGAIIKGFEMLETLVATSFDDVISVDDHVDFMYVFAGAGADTVTAAAGQAILSGDDGDDILTASGSGAYLWGGSGNDVLKLSGTGNGAYGDDGDDVIVCNGTGNAFAGGYGFDTLDYSSAAFGISVDLSSGETSNGDSIREIEAVRGGEFVDVLIGSYDANTLSGGAGNDTLRGGGGNDQMEGGAGTDTFAHARGDGHDVVLDFVSGETLRIYDFTFAQSVVQSGGDVIVTLSGSDKITLLSTTVATVKAGLKFDPVPPATLIGTGGDDSLFGGLGNDTLSGLGGNDTLNGGFGADLMNGGLGNDTIFVNDAADVVIEERRGGTDTVYALGNYVLGRSVEAEMLYAYFDPYEGAAYQPWPTFALTGNELAQTIRGGNVNDVLSGLGGADTLLGLYGNDTLDGGTGNDTLVGGFDFDTFLYRLNGGKDIISDFAAGESINIYDYAAAQSVVQSGTNVVVTLARGQQITVNYVTLADVTAALHFMGPSGGGGGGTGSTITGTSNSETLNGTASDDVIKGLGGRDTLKGNGGNDTLNGGTGNDTLSGGTGTDKFVFTELAAGNDRITDFVSGTDKIDFTAYGITSANVTKTVARGNLALGVDADHNGSTDFTITLTGVTAIAAGDLLF